MNSLFQKFTASCRVSAVSAIYVMFFSLGLFLAAPSLFSQGNQGRITGTITDQSGGAMSGATVTVLDVQRGTSRER
jgi:hypothetical protein